MEYIGLFLIIATAWYILSRVGAHIVFRPQKKRWPLKLPFQNVSIGPITGIYLPAQGQQPTLLFFHGRGGNVSHFENFAQAYAPLGYGVLAFDYRGFGLSKGTPNQKHLEQDAVSAVTYALETLCLSPQQLVLYGHSLGNAPALFAANYFKNTLCKALILQSPFLSTPDMAASWACGAYVPHTWKYRLIRALVTPFLWPNRFDNTRLCSGIKIPVLLCSSKADQTLPWAQSAKLADAISHVQRFLSPTGGHDEFVWSVPAVDNFLQSY
ncbi:MAG: alpha/beta fold hydrolase [Elusimicrobiaceae bacterium]|nr:alpha/beta fold hydrolase [Elusimicrobiaceae bacterium]